MRVKQLIEQLKTMPSNARVGIANHDQDNDDIDGIVQYVILRDPERSRDPSYAPDVTVVIHA